MLYNENFHTFSFIASPIYASISQSTTAPTIQTSILTSK